MRTLADALECSKQLSVGQDLGRLNLLGVCTMLAHARFEFVIDTEACQEVAWLR